MSRPHDSLWRWQSLSPWACQIIHPEISQLINHMPRKLFKKYAPDPSKIRDHKHLRHFGKWLHDPNLWHMNRRSVSGAVATGLFWALVPMPMQTIPAVITAILLRVNLPIVFGLVWLTNPITFPPILYLAYLLGLKLLPSQTQDIQFEISAEWIAASFNDIWQPLLLGSMVMAVTASVLGYVLVRGAWRWHLVRQHRLRQQR